jgi:predicted DCC family thiol-disulfide oxidoreductase YuxK
VLILYDADCGFCTWCMGKVLAIDRRHALTPHALQAPDTDALLPGMSQEQKMASWHAVDDQGRVTSGGQAAAPLFHALDHHAAARAIERNPGLADRGYYAVANHRSALGKLVTRGARRRARERIARHGRLPG